MSNHRICCCGASDCDYPQVDMTLTWADSDVTKTWGDLEWTNGQTRSLCPSSYDCYTISTLTPTTFIASEAWVADGLQMGAGSARRSDGGTVNPNSLWDNNVKLTGISGANMRLLAQSRNYTAGRVFVGGASTFSNIASDGFGVESTHFAAVAGHSISTEHFGFVTDTNGVMYQWQRGANGSLEDWGC